MLLLGFFLAFNAAYFPIRQYQSERAPENFAAFAERMAAAGQTEMAARQLAAGIGWFHPAYAAPYEQLAAAGDAPARAQALLYARLAAGGLDLPAMEELSRLVPSVAGNAPDLEPAFALWREAGLVQPKDAAAGNGHKAAVLQAGHGHLQADGRIGDAGRTPVSILVASGPRAVMMIDGVDYGGSTRGLYVAVLEAATGRILQLGQFDLWESWDESLRMAQFLRKAPEGSIGVFAVSKEASVYFDHARLTPEMEAFGLERQAMLNHRLRFFGLKFAFAAIGVKGGTGGMQAWSPGEFKGHEGHPVCVAVWPGSAQ